MALRHRHLAALGRFISIPESIATEYGHQLMANFAALNRGGLGPGATATPGPSPPPQPAAQTRARARRTRAWPAQRPAPAGLRLITQALRAPGWTPRRCSPSC